MQGARFWEPYEGDPVHVPTGRKIREILEGRRAKPDPDDFQKMFIMARWELFKHYIDPLLRGGIDVYSDRGYESTLAYVAVDGTMSYEEVIELHGPFPCSDMTLLLDLPAEVAAQRVGDSKPDIFENLDFQKRVREQYLDLYEQAPCLGLNIVKIDVLGLDPEEVADVCEQQIKNYRKTRG